MTDDDLDYDQYMADRHGVDVETWRKVQAEAPLVQPLPDEPVLTAWPEEGQHEHWMKTGHLSEKDCDEERGRAVEALLHGSGPDWLRRLEGQGCARVGHADELMALGEKFRRSA